MKGLLPFAASAGRIGNHDHRQDADSDSQAEAPFRLMSDAQKQLLIDNIVGAMKSDPRLIQVRQVTHFAKADPDGGTRIACG
jgi:catalase